MATPTVPPTAVRATVTAVAAADMLVLIQQLLPLMMMVTMLT
jgi:hypothetical protein